MNTPRFPAVDREGVIQERHLPSRLSPTSLEHTIQTIAHSGGGGGHSEVGGLDNLATKVGYGGAGNLSVAVVADSIMNDDNDSMRIFSRLYTETLPDTCRCTYRSWKTDTNSWETVVDKEGDIAPATDGVVLVDTFSRVETNVQGSTADNGAVWSGGAPLWSSDGNVARASGQATLAIDAGDRSMETTLELLITTDSTVVQNLRVMLAAPSASGTGGVLVNIGVTSSGSLLITPYTYSEGWVRFGDILRGSSVGVDSGSSTEIPVKVSAKVDIQNLSLSLEGPTGIISTTGQLSESQYVNAGTWLQVVAFSSTMSAFAIDSVEVTTAPQPPRGDTFDMWNGAIAGGRTSTFNESKLEEMFDGVHVDVLILSMGHNNGNQSGEAFTQELSEWATLWRSLHPETTGIIWVSQNPQYPPASGIIAHRDRQLAVRSFTVGSWDYVGGFEAFATQPDGGASLMSADGVHPSTPPGSTTVGDYGAVLMADTILGAVHARI